MELSHVIIGQIVTEKSEIMKSASKTYTIQIALGATKVDVKNALKKFYDVDVSSIRIVNVGPKTRRFGRNSVMEKRHRAKKALVTLAPKSKALDLASFKS